LFGDGTRGNLGHGDTENRVLPKRVLALIPFRVATVAAGLARSLALTACGRVFWWGSRIASATEFEMQTLPELVDSTFGGERVRSIAASLFAAYAVTEAGLLYA
jgi:alpha-tubulin suppressor-like RCC1 family protein